MSELDEFIASAEQVGDVLVPDLLDDAQTRLNDVEERLTRAIATLTQARDYVRGIDTSNSQLRLVV